MVSLLLLSMVMILGLVVNRQGRLPGLPRFGAASLHRSVSLLAVLFVAVHVITAIADPFVTIRIAAAIIPFSSAYKPFWLGLGAVSLDLIIALIVTSLARARIGRRTWRGLHWLAYAAWPVAFAHSIGSSTDLQQRRLADAGDRLRAGRHRRGRVAGLAVDRGQAPLRARGQRRWRRPLTPPGAPQSNVPRSPRSHCRRSPCRTPPAHTTSSAPLMKAGRS